VAAKTQVTNSHLEVWPHPMPVLNSSTRKGLGSGSDQGLVRSGNEL